MGRPSSYTEEIANKIINLISTTSQGLVTICKSADMPSAVTVYAWLNNPDHVDFLNRYVRAREEQADLLADEIIEIADDTSRDTVVTDKGLEIPDMEWIARSRLRVDARKWKASKLAPKKYGDKLDLTSKGERVTAAVVLTPEEAKMLNDELERKY